MDRSKIILCSIAGVAVVGLVFFGYLAFASHSKAMEMVESRDTAANSIRKIYKDSSPFPSQENAREVRSNMEQLTFVRSELTNILASRNIPRTKFTPTPSFFVQRLQKLATKKIEDAPIVDGSKVIAEDFTFGFERYVGQNPSMPQEGEVTRLFQQLVVVDELIDALFEARVSRILEITREVFEAKESNARESRGRSRAAGRRKVRAPSPSKNHCQHFSVKFLARQEAAVAFINNLAKFKYFVLVTDVSFRKIKEDVRLPGAKDEESLGDFSDRERRSSRKSSRRSLASRRVEEKDSGQEAETGPTISKLPPGQRLMSGAGLNNTLEVVVDFDVYTFGKEEK